MPAGIAHSGRAVARHSADRLVSGRTRTSTATTCCGARRPNSHDYYTLYTLDAYVYLYSGRRERRDQKREYIQSRLDLVDYIVMDDFYVQLYQHLPEAEHAVVKRYYEQLFSGELGFDLIKTFKVYPSLFGVTINDDAAELSSRMNDHPRVYVFKRRQSG